jgi:hypothetical protein
MGKQMLHIQDKSDTPGFADLAVDGILNASSLPILKNLIEKKISKNKKVRLQLGGIIHCDRMGIHFLKEYQDKIVLDGMSEFLKMEMRLETGHSAGME